MCLKFRNILRPILQHPPIPTFTEVSITGQFWSAVAEVKTIEYGAKKTEAQGDLTKVIDSAADFTSGLCIPVLNVHATASMSENLLTRFSAYFNSIRVGRLSVSNIDFI